MWYAIQAIKWKIIKYSTMLKITQCQILIYSTKEIKRMKVEVKTQTWQLSSLSLSLSHFLTFILHIWTMKDAEKIPSLFLFSFSVCLGAGVGKGALSSKILHKHYKQINMLGPESRHVLHEMVDTIQTSVWHAFRACHYISSVSIRRTHDNQTSRHAHAFLIVNKVASKQNMAAF